MILCSWLTLLPNPQWLSEEVSVYPTHHSRGSGRVCRVGLLALGFALTFGKAAHAQTWTSNRSTPTPGEIVAVDGTGEDGWLFGAEDVADDGLDMFTQPERKMDIRSAYASTTANDFYFRLYVSDAGSPGANVSGFAFLNSDRNRSTGGTAVAPEIDARFTSDPSPGGYEYVFAVQGNGNVLDLWEWDAMAGEYVVATPNGNRADAEAGTDRDPITSASGEHGYLQGWIELGLVGLDSACDAELYFRSLNETADLGDGDLDVGQVGPCHPADSNNDGVPDRIVSTERCTSDAQCPVNARCLNGRCRFTPLCENDGDCASDQECGPNGYCVARVGDTCSEPADCSTRLCDGNVCARCMVDGDCESGYVCAADGRCVSENAPPDGGDGGIVLEPGEEVQGGACTCAVPSTLPVGGRLLLLLLPGLFWRRRASGRKGDSGNEG